MPRTDQLKPHQFKKGQTGNPGGRPKIPDDIRKAANVTTEQFVKTASEFLLMDRTELTKVLQNPEASMIELLIGGILAKAVKDHDSTRAEWIIARTIGKAKDFSEVTIRNWTEDLKTIPIKTLKQIAREADE